MLKFNLCYKFYSYYTLKKKKQKKKIICLKIKTTSILKLYTYCYIVCC